MIIQDVVSNSLKKGTGRALLVIRDNPDTDFSEIIFNACIQALGYDPQCEGNKADYLYEIIQMSKHYFLLEQKLIEAIHSEEIEGWDLVQLFGIVKIFAAKGNKTARANLYKRFSSYIGEDYQGIGIAEQLIDLDGLEALKFVAEIRGKQLIKSASDWEDDYLLRYTKDAFLDSNPLEYLKEMAIDNQYIQTYLNKIEECQQTRKDSPKIEWNYETIKKRIAKGSGLSFLRRFANQDIMLKIAEDFVNEKDFEISKKYLQAFSYYEFPLDFRHLIPFTKASDEMVRDYALKALSFFKNSYVREIALTNLSSRVNISTSLKILSNNFEMHDHKLVEQILFELNDNNDDFHDISGQVIDIYEKNKTKLSLNAMQTCYSVGHCSICRKKIVEIMLRDGTLTDWIREEAMYDCHSDTRELVMIK